MSALYAYGVMRAADATAAPDAPGVGGGALRFAPAGELAVLVGDAPEGELRRARRNLLAHIRVLEAAQPMGPILPMRFGVVADDAAAVAAAVTPRAAELMALLDRYRGCAEYGVRVEYDRAAALAALGIARPDFARRRAELVGRAGADAQMALMNLGREIAEALDARRKAAERAILAAVKPVARDHVLRAPESDVEALRAEFLLPTADEAAFLAAVEAAAAATDFAPGGAPTVRVVGPAPIYNFVSLALDAPAAAAA
jgi:hypothetical protein